MTWFVYMVRCSDNSLYTGITTDIARRLHEHNYDDKRAAKYTKCRRPVVLVYQHKYDSRSKACQQEYQLKQLSKIQKEQLVGSVQ